MSPRQEVVASEDLLAGRAFHEALVPIANAEPTAVASFNLHREHFGSVFGIRMADGGTASSSCVGFGLERITLALFRAHGLDATGLAAGSSCAPVARLRRASAGEVGAHARAF